MTVRYRRAASSCLAAGSSACGAAVARGGVSRFASPATGSLSACLMTRHIAAEKARNIAVSSDMYSQVKFSTAAPIDCAGQVGAGSVAWSLLGRALMALKPAAGPALKCDGALRRDKR